MHLWAFYDPQISSEMRFLLWPSSQFHLYLINCGKALSFYWSLRSIFFQSMKKSRRAKTGENGSMYEHHFGTNFATTLFIPKHQRTFLDMSRLIFLCNFPTSASMIFWHHFLTVSVFYLLVNVVITLIKNLFRWSRLSECQQYSQHFKCISVRYSIYNTKFNTHSFIQK